MANIREYRDKTGKLVSYNIKVYRGQDMDGRQLAPYCTTFPVEPTWTEKFARKKAEAFAANFEKDCRMGITSASNKRFDEYCEYVLTLKEQRGTIKHTTLTRYRELTKRIYPAMGHIKIANLQAPMLNQFYSDLQGIGLCGKTVKHYHALISVVLAQAVKEGIVPYNVAERATLPKLVQKEPNYFQPEQVDAIRDALEQEPLRWKMLVHLFLITGARRGELLGLKWGCVDFEQSRIHICNNVLYTPDRGLYEDTPKTEKSKRYIVLPAETMDLFRQYRKWQMEERLRLGAYFIDRDFVFTQDNGEPLHPDSVTNYLTKFSRKYNLPHINAHAFRHTMASILYYHGVDSVSVSRRLGHAQVSTTANIYAHIIEDADQRNAEILSDIFLKKA
jgi:hypothetical protein